MLSMVFSDVADLGAVSMLPKYAMVFQNAQIIQMSGSLHVKPSPCTMHLC